MRNLLACATTLSISVLCGACSGSVIYGGGGAGGGGGSGSGASSACPKVAPVSGSACTLEGRRCTFGADPRPDCRAEWLCSGAKWTTTKNVCAPPGSDCAAVAPNQVCSTEGDHCVVNGSTICTCNACLGGPCMAPPPKWSCAGPPSAPGCPALVPNDGTACTEQGLECVYGNPCLGSGADVKCVQGLWLWTTQIACPV